jgi:hypothetical protein
MKKGLLFIIGLLLFLKVEGQKDSSFWFNEFSVSVNHTVLPKTDFSDGRFGFGVGAYRVFRKEKPTNITFGFEFNRTGQFRDYEYRGHFSNVTDITYSYYAFSLPFAVRFNVGKKVKFFAENGLFLDLFARVMSKGTMHSTSFGVNQPTIHEEYEFSQLARVTPADFGSSFGIGIKIPVSRHALLIKSDFKCGFVPFVSQNSESDLLNWNLRLMVSFQL